LFSKAENKENLFFSSTVKEPNTQTRGRRGVYGPEETSADLAYQEMLTNDFCGSCLWFIKYELF